MKSWVIIINHFWQYTGVLEIPRKIKHLKNKNYVFMKTWVIIINQFWQVTGVPENSEKNMFMSAYTPIYDKPSLGRASLNVTWYSQSFTSCVSIYSTCTYHISHTSLYETQIYMSNLVKWTSCFELLYFEWNNSPYFWLDVFVIYYMFLY